MAGSLVKRVMLKIVADDGDSEAKIDRISAKADELGARHPDLKVRIDTAAASAKVKVLREELKATTREAEKPKKFSLSGIVPAIGKMNLFQKAMLGLNIATSVGEPLLAGAAVAAGGLAAGLASAGAGALVFGVVAKSALSQAATASQAAQSAQVSYTASIKAAHVAYSQAMASATTASQRQAAAAKLQSAEQSAVTAKARAMAAAYAGLSPAQRQLAQTMTQVTDTWHKFIADNTSGVAGVLRQGIGLLPGILKDAQQFLPPVEAALHVIIADIGHGLNSSGFQHFVSDLSANVVPSLLSIAGIIGHIAVGAGGVLEAFMPEAQRLLAGLNSETAKFAHWGQTLTSHSGFQSLMSMFRSETPMAVKILANLGSAVKTVVSDMAGLDGVGNSQTLLQIAMPFSTLLKVLVQANPAVVRFGLYLLAASSGAKKVKSAVDGISSGLSILKGGVSAVGSFAKGMGSAEAAASEATGAWGTFGGKISSVMSSAGSMITGLGQKMGILRGATEAETVAQGELDTAMDANPIGLVVVAVGALAAGFVLLWKHSTGFRNFWKGLWHDIQHIVGGAVSWIGGHWKLVLGILTGPIGAATIFITGHWHQITSGAANMFHSVVGFFTSLPGRILHAVGNLGSLLYSAGKAVIQGLINGIESMIGGIGHAIGGIAGEIRSFLPFSPAKKGPLSGGGAPDRAGRQIGAMLATGITSSSPAVAAASARMAAAAAVTGGAAAGHPGPGGGVMRLEVKGGGGMSGLDRLFLSWLQEEVRKLGGDPLMFQRKVAYA